MDARTAKALGKFYTRPEVARRCVELLKRHNPCYRRGLTMIEPSAGSGAFLLPGAVGFDLAPEHPSIQKLDFLADDLPPAVLAISQHTAFAGNPPFGKKGDLAVRFINRALDYAPVVGFILPIQFRKWSAQKLINTRAKLVVDHDLPADAFTFMGQPYKVRCSFQIWSRANITLQRDQRIHTAPPTSHSDFNMWQFNCTAQAERYFDYDWDFAVLRQGFGDYHARYVHGTALDRKKQWAFIKAHDEAALARLMALDFDSLSKLNTAIPGYGKADVVSEYVKGMAASA